MRSVLQQYPTSLNVDLTRLFTKNRNSRLAWQDCSANLINKAYVFYYAADNMNDNFW